MAKLSRRLMNEVEFKRFAAKVEIDNSDPEGCWIWTAAHGGARLYAQFSIERAPIRAHVASYWYFNGPVPDGLEVDHSCCNHSCVNPEHLEAVTNAENNRRRIDRTSHCKRGHEFNEANTYLNPDGHRECRVCRYEAVKRHRAGVMP